MPRRIARPPAGRTIELKNQIRACPNGMKIT